LQSFTTRIAGGDFKGWDKYLTALFMKLRTAHDFLKLGDSIHFCTCPVCLKHLMSKFSKKGEWIRVILALESFVIYNMRLLLKERNITEGMAPLDQSNLTNVTLREKEVLQFILDGWTNKETAGQMGLSVKTVEAHRANLMRKLGIHNVAGLARYMWSSTHGL
jgi:DNA-binding CsgD family transcriptional regulator